MSTSQKVLPRIKENISCLNTKALWGTFLILYLGIDIITTYYVFSNYPRNFHELNPIVRGLGLHLSLQSLIISKVVVLLVISPICYKIYKDAQNTEEEYLINLVPLALLLSYVFIVSNNILNLLEFYY